MTETRPTERTPFFEFQARMGLLMGMHPSLKRRLARIERMGVRL